MILPRIHVDFETRAIIDIALGADVYARHWATAPILLGIIAPSLRVRKCIDFLLDTPGYQKSIYPACPHGAITYGMIKPVCPPEILLAIERGYVFVAHNARFEQAIWYHICHLKWGWPMPERWSCTAARARYNGIRASLSGAGSDLEIVNQKLESGKDFINMFCKPRKYKGAKKNGIITQLWAEPQDEPQAWLVGKEYCLRDVEAELEVDAALPELPSFEQEIWELDFKMNTRGLPMDIPSVERAIRFSDYFMAMNDIRFDELCQLRPTQRDKVLDYLNQREEINTLGDLKSKTMKRLLLTDLPSDLHSIVSIRLESGRASPKKLMRIRDCTDDDGRARGLFLYGGAHTLRWSAKRIQPQNFMRPVPEAPAEHLFSYLESPVWEDKENPTAWVDDANISFIKPLSYLATNMRGFIKAPEGFKLVVGDYSQIEARTLVWLARCLAVMDGYRNGEDVYVRFAGDHMYNRPYDDYFYFVGSERRVKKEFKRERQIAKSAVLGCGYGLGWLKFIEYCDNSDIIITEEESKRTIQAYREAHPEIADPSIGLWARVERCAIAAVENEGEVISLANTGVTFHVRRSSNDRYWLNVTLPSGRSISYYRPKVRVGTKFGRACKILSFRTEWNGGSYREDTYGGKLIENLVQAIARDICATGALNAERAGYPVIGLVHDEVITLPPIGFGNHEGLCAELCRLPAWVTDLPVAAEGGTSLRYGGH